MLGFILTLILDVATGSSSKMLDAVSSFEDPPRSDAAKRNRRLALFFLLAGACCAVIAAILFDVNRPNAVDDIFGWTALLCMLVCVILGFRYQFLNGASDHESQL